MNPRESEGLALRTLGFTQIEPLGIFSPNVDSRKMSVNLKH